MSDHHLFDDEATLYVLGRLTEAERTEFEARLAQSAELRALVRELEEGAVAVAMAAPRRRVPQQAWEQIEKTITQETKPHVLNLSLWFGWLRNGWAVAAACLVGWLIHAFWPDGAGSPEVVPAPLATQVKVQPGIPPDSTRAESGRVTPLPRNVPNPERRSPEANALALTRENGALQLQNEDLAKQLMHLSQVLTQQQALLSEPSRVKFLQVPPVSAADERPMVAPVSTNLQRALFFAVARELGWTPSVPLTLGGETGSTQAPQGNSANAAPAPISQTDVDFVDLRTASNGVANPAGQSPVELEPTDTSEPPTLSSASASSNAIPTFVSGTTAFMAFDASVVPTGSSVRFWSVNSWGQYESLGGAVLQNNSMVVAVPFTIRNWGENVGNLTVIAGTPSGSTNVFYLSTPTPQP